jgi:hypothetical protein
MTRHRANLRESPIEKLRYALLDNRATIGLVLAFLALAGLFAALGLWVMRQNGLPGEREEGEVLGFGTHSSSRVGERPLIVVRTRSGLVVQLPLSGQALHNCRRGSRIRLIRHGAILAVDRRGCTAPAS